MRPAVSMRDGKPGEPIRGSAMFRAYCRTCGEPMRVPESQRDCARRGLCECSDCYGLVRNECGRQRAARG